MEELIEVYKENFTTYALVFKFMKLQYTLANVMTVLLFLSAYSIVIIIPTAFINTSIIKTAVLCYGVILLLTVVILVWFNFSARKIIFDRYKIRSSSGIWRPSEFDEMQTKMLISYLKIQKVYTKEKMGYLITNLQDSIKRKKSPSIWVAGVFLALFTPLWNQYMTYTFKFADESNWKDVSIFVLVVSIIIAFVSLTVGGFKKIFFFLQDIVMSEHHSIVSTKLLEHIQSIQLMYQEPVKKIIVP